MITYSDETAESFREWRKVHGLSRKEAAYQLGLSKHRIIDYEIGRAQIPLIVERAMLVLDLVVENRRLKALCNDYEARQTAIPKKEDVVITTAKEQFKELQEVNAQNRRDAAIKRNLSWMEDVGEGEV